MRESPDFKNTDFNTMENLSLAKTKKDVTDTTKAPSHLSVDSKAFFDYVIYEYDGFDQHHIELLTLACEAWDRAVQARELIEKDGLTFVDRHGAIKPHAAVAIEKDSRTAFARIIREIGLDVAAPNDTRPPALPANGGNAYAN
jgi:P27 family predicted phage terminase small subunit